MIYSNERGSVIDSKIEYKNQFTKLILRGKEQFQKDYKGLIILDNKMFLNYVNELFGIIDEYNEEAINYIKRGIR